MNMEALWVFLPGCNICCNQDFINTGLELGEIGKALSLESTKSKLSSLSLQKISSQQFL